MTEYKLVLLDGTEYSFNGSAVTLALKKAMTTRLDSVGIEQGVVPKSYGPGSLLSSSARIEAGSISVIVPFAFKTDTEYFSAANALIRSVVEATYLIDVTNNKRTKIAGNAVDETFEQGSERRTGEFIAKFVQLTPYWEDETATSVPIALAPNTPTNLLVNNTGFLPAPFVLSLTCPIGNLCGDFTAEVVDTGEGFNLLDSLFGGDSIKTLVLDTELGTCLMGANDRTPYIAKGSGYFSIPVGSINVRMNAVCTGATPSNLTGSLVYRKRYYR